MEITELNAKWHVVLTWPGFETRVAALLEKKNIHHYCPIQPAGAHVTTGKKLIMEPVFNSYVFVKITEMETQLVLKTKGVLNFAYWINQMAVINEADIETIRTFLTDYYSVRVEKIPVDLSMQADIIEEAYTTSEEILHSVRAVLPSLGYQLVTDAVKPKLEKVKIIRRESKTIESFFNRLPSILKTDRVFREG